MKCKYTFDDAEKCFRNEISLNSYFDAGLAFLRQGGERRTEVKRHDEIKQARSLDKF